MDRSHLPPRVGGAAVPCPALAELRGIEHGEDVKTLQFNKAKKDILELPDSALEQLDPHALFKQRTCVPPTLCRISFTVPRRSYLRVRTSPPPPRVLPSPHPADLLILHTEKSYHTDYTQPLSGKEEKYLEAMPAAFVDRIQTRVRGGARFHSDDLKAIIAGNEVRKGDEEVAGGAGGGETKEGKEDGAGNSGLTQAAQKNIVGKAAAGLLKPSANASLLLERLHTVGWRVASLVMLSFWSVLFGDIARRAYASTGTNRSAAMGYDAWFSVGWVREAMNEILSRVCGRGEGRAGADNTPVWENAAFSGMELYEVWHTWFRWFAHEPVLAIFRQLEGNGSCMFGVIYNHVHLRHFTYAQSFRMLEARSKHEMTRGLMALAAAGGKDFEQGGGC